MIACVRAHSFEPTGKPMEGAGAGKEGSVPVTGCGKGAFIGARWGGVGGWGVGGEFEAE